MSSSFLLPRGRVIAAAGVLCLVISFYIFHALNYLSIRCKRWECSQYRHLKCMQSHAHLSFRSTRRDVNVINIATWSAPQPHVHLSCILGSPFRNNNDNASEKLFINMSHNEDEKNLGCSGEGFDSSRLVFVNTLSSGKWTMLTDRYKVTIWKYF